MHPIEPASATPDHGDQPWHRLLNRYHWFVLVVAALGWLFDTMDQQLFTLARAPAIRALVHYDGDDPAAKNALVAEHSGYATSIFLIGWATGGIGFGILGDRIGRAKTMMLTILLYSLFTGFSALSVSVWDFALWRFLTGLGVGGEFAVGVSLVAEVMPDRARPFALGLLQAFSAVGNVAAAAISILLGKLEETETIASSWRYMFVIGALPALLTLLIMRRLKEPERWRSAAATGGLAGKKLGSFAELFGTPRWRQHCVVGVLLASSGVIGLWGIGFFSYDLTRLVFKGHFDTEARETGQAVYDISFVLSAIGHPEYLDKYSSKVAPDDLVEPFVSQLYKSALELRNRSETVSFETAMEKLDPAVRKIGLGFGGQRTFGLFAQEAKKDVDDTRMTDWANDIVARGKRIRGQLTLWAGITSMMLNLGAFFGIYTFSRVTHRAGRKSAFAISFVIAMLSTGFVFWQIHDPIDVFWMMPLMGFCQLSLFGGYAIYFPELFPTRLRSTGTSFCYNVGRYVAAIGPSALGLLTARVFNDTNQGGLYPDNPMRWAGISMCSVFLLGLVVLPFAPETRGQPLPE